MNLLLAYLACLGICGAVWFARLFGIAAAERDNAISGASHWQAVARQRQREIVGLWADKEMMDRERRLLNDLMGKSPRHSPVSHHTIEELMGETVEDGPESWGV